MTIVLIARHSMRLGRPDNRLQKVSIRQPQHAFQNGSYADYMQSYAHRQTVVMHCGPEVMQGLSQKRKEP